MLSDDVILAAVFTVLLIVWLIRTCCLLRSRRHRAEEHPILPRFSSFRSTRELGECVICLEQMGVTKKLVMLPCGHTYHAHCIRRWVQQQPTCPLCVTKVVVNEGATQDV